MDGFAKNFLRLLLLIVSVSFISVRAQKTELKPDTALISATLVKAADAQPDTAILLYNTAIQAAEKYLKNGGGKAYQDAVKRKLIIARLGLGLALTGLNIPKRWMLTNLP